MNRGRVAFAVLLPFITPFIARAVPIGYCPGLDQLIDAADEIVVLRIDRHLSDFSSPTLYSTHECYIYQTIKDKVKEMIKDAIAYQAQGHEKRQEFLKSLLSAKEAAERSAEPDDEDTVRVETAEKLHADTPADSAGCEFPRPTVDGMRTLAERIAKGDQAAFDRLGETAKELYRDIDYSKEGNRVLSNLALMRAAFDVLGEQAADGNQKAFEALRRALGSADLRSFVPDSLGIAAAAGHTEALEMLLQHNRHGILLSSAVFAVQTPARKNNDKAVDFLVGVIENAAHRALWHAAAQGLAAPAAGGNRKAKAALKRYEEATGTPAPEPELAAKKPTLLETQNADDGQPGEQIGEVLGKPVYRNQIRTAGNVRLPTELHRLFMGPVMQEYRQTHQAEITPTESEIATATAYFDKEHQERIEAKEAELLQQLKAVEEKLAGTGLTEEEKKRLEIERRTLQSRLKPPGRFFAVFVLDNWKFQRHLYDRYGGGRILWQQAGLEAFDAMHRWLKSQESQGKFNITDPRLRSVFYEY